MNGLKSVGVRTLGNVGSHFGTQRGCIHCAVGRMQGVLALLTSGFLSAFFLSLLLGTFTALFSFLQQRTYRAMYDYSAQDEDEVSFRDGDYIINVQPIDDGWMYGTVQRTGKTGMLPANYIEFVN